MGIRTAILGSGFMGRVHLEALRRLGNIEPVPVRGRDTSAVAAAMKDSTIEAVHICTPNASHFPLAKRALEAGKHVLCEKPLATSVADAETLVKLAESKGLRNATCHNLRYYPQVQQMRAMREAGELGEILIAQGTYSQDWLLHDTDWNWRIDSAEAGPSRALADIGSHWCDMVEHVTGLRIASVCADLHSFHETRATEDFASVMFALGKKARGAFTVSQVSAGRKNRLHIEIYGKNSSVAWDQERPDELWIGHRDYPNQTSIKDPALLRNGARAYADLPGGHSEGYDDTFKQVFRRFYASIADSSVKPEYPQFADGLRQLKILDAELASHRERRWIEVPE